MINLAVINLKTLIRKTIKIIIAILVIAMIFKFIKLIYNGIKNFDIKNLISQNSIINDNLAISNYFETEENTIESSGLKKILVAQLAVFSGVEEQKSEIKNNQEIPQLVEIENKTDEILTEVENQSEELNTQLVVSTESNQTVQTEIVESHNKKDVYTDIYNTVQIKNESNYSLTEEMITPNINYSNNGIIIYHTHTCESYTPTENSQYVASRKLSNN